MENAARIVQATAAVIQKEGLFLITRRLKTSHLGHLWEFPGGKLELGETPEQCIIRECQEEIGVLVAPQRRLRDLHYHYPDFHLHLFFIACTIIEGTPRAIECSDLAWVKAEELKSFEFPAADLEIIDELSQSVTRLDSKNKKSEERHAG